MTAIDKQSRLPDLIGLNISSGVHALEERSEHSEDRLIEMAIRVFQNSPDIGFGDEVSTDYQIYSDKNVFESYFVVWKFDRVQREPDSDAPSVELTLRLDSEC